MTRVNDLVIRIATVNGTGSASANGLLMKSIFRMGIPVVGKTIFLPIFKAYQLGMR